MTPTETPLPFDEEQPLQVSYGRDFLVVDDSQTNLIAIEAALAPLGRKLVPAYSGVEALGRLLEQDFALIILDVAMPGMDGFETARMVRSRERNRDTPIIFITGFSWESKAVLRGYELGAFDFLMKPIHPDVLRAKATVFIQLQERTLELAAKAEELRQIQSRTHERELQAQRRRFESEVMERQMEQLAQADRRKDEFLAILAHELRNPLQPLQTAVEVLEHEPDKPVPVRIRKIVQRQVQHITRLVDDLLDVSRFTAGKLELRRELIDLEAVVEEAVATCRSAIDARKHHLEVTGFNPPAMVHGDPVRLVQCVCNLINNAAKYTEPGGMLIIDWGAHRKEGFVRVTDNGRGIPIDLLPKVFDMFVQERVTPDGAGGLGLGLGLVKRLVELHGGNVRATSEGRGTGATFEIRLPLVDDATLGRLKPMHAKTGQQDRPLRAVVCDDAPDLRDLVADLLRLRGHEVTVVGDGPAAIELIVAEKPDVALIDIGLPDMDGYEVARVIRRQITTHPPRLIAMTGYGQASDRAAAFEAGFDAHIVKPASADKILRALYGTEEA
ncbi:MAG TPA: response regulator [Kofleriaceae bacterium]|nr:response regulator [Kofleriaceae bacterium]